MTRIDRGDDYLTSVLPAVLVFGAGLTLVVAPVTATVLAAADSRHSGIASGINNAVSRVAGLLAIAVLPIVAGLTGDDFYNPAKMVNGFHMAMFVCAALAVFGGILAWLTISSEVLAAEPDQPAEAVERACSDFSCGVAGTPLVAVAESARRATAGRGGGLRWPGVRACGRTDRSCVVMLVGVLFRVLLGGFTGEIIAVTLLSLGAGAILLLVFLEVGLSEDRERAAGGGQAPPPSRPSPFAAHGLAAAPPELSVRSSGPSGGPRFVLPVRARRCAASSSGEGLRRVRRAVAWTRRRARCRRATKRSSPAGVLSTSTRAPSLSTRNVCGTPIGTTAALPASSSKRSSPALIVSRPSSTT